MSDVGDPGEAQLSAELSTLDPNARYVLGALAVLGGPPASLQTLGEVSGVRDLRPAVEELERRRLITREPGDRVSVPPEVQGRLTRLLPTEAAHAQRQIDRLAAMGAPTEVMRTTEVASPPPDRRGTNWPLIVLAGVAIAAAGTGLGYLIADQTSEATTVTESSSTETQTVTETGTGSTTTVEVTTTATETTTVTETATVTETQTVTVGG